MDHRSRTTRRTALFADTLVDDSPEHPTPLISPFPSLPVAPASLPLARVLSSSPRDSDSYSPERRSVSLIRRGLFRLCPSITAGSLRFYRYRQDRPGSDLGAVRLIGVNDHGAVSPIVELNGKDDSLASRAPFG